MRVFIITMDDPVQTTPFIKNVIRARKDWIIGVAITKGSRLTIGKKKSKVSYLFSLLLILGPLAFLKNSWLSLINRLYKILAPYSVIAQSKSFSGWLIEHDILLKEISSPNNPSFINFLKPLGVDVIINQSPAILKKELLAIPKIGTINRHNALLPKNRGRMTPFWVLYKGEKETGVSIHFVNEKIDDGQIIVQKRFTVAPGETFNSLVRKNYELAPVAMIEALDKLNANDTSYLANNHELATYNSTPGLKEAFRYRINMLWRNK